jgi:ribosomal 50S subunit-associated protein YjgA (DUF615 family)
LGDRVLNAWQAQQALSAWHGARERLIAEGNDPSDLSDLLGPEEGDVQDILARTLRAAVEAKHMAEAADDRAKQIQVRRDRFKRQAETLRGLGFAIMDAIGKPKVTLPDLTATIRAGLTSAVITDETTLPDEYFVTERRLDKAKVAADLKQGVVIEGAELSNGLPSLAIRSK